MENPWDTTVVIAAPAIPSQGIKTKLSATFISAALMRLADWFAYLRANGVYDAARIIIVSDHGAQKNYVNRITVDGSVVNLDNFNPLLLVKDFNASGPLSTDNRFMTNADVPSMALDGVVDAPVNPFTGTPLSVDRKNAPLYVAPSGGIHLEDRAAGRVTLDPSRDFWVHTNIFEPANWERAGKED